MLLSGLLASLVISATVVTATDETEESRSARGLYNEGTQKLQNGKLREAELVLQTAVAKNEDAIQPVALYNLAHVRFQQGAAVLKESPDGPATQKRGNNANLTTEAALHAADEALAGYDLDAIIAAYMNGRGVRKELKEAMKAVKKALESHGAVIARWQRASGDFKSAHELQVSYQDAMFNAEVVDQHLAKLIDQQEIMMMCMKCMGDSKQELKEKMDKLKELLPESLKQQCEGDDEEDEDAEQPKEPKEGQKEADPRDGRELWLTPEEAARLLEAMKLDGNRKLPMGFEESLKPKERGGRVW